MKKYLLCILCLFILSVNGQDDSITESKIYTLLDSALHNLNANRDDFTIHGALILDDPHKLPIVKELFLNPMKTLSFTKKYEKLLKDSLSSYLSEALEELNFPTLPNNLKKISQQELNTSLPNEAQWYVQQFLYYRNNIFHAQSELDSVALSTIQTHIDSIMMVSEESQNLSVYELKKEEEEGREFSKSFFKTTTKVNPYNIINHSIPYFVKTQDKLLIDTLKKDIPDTLIELSINGASIAIGGSGNNVYQKNYDFIIDFGGNDTYLIPNIQKYDHYGRPLVSIIDFDGDDHYFGKDYALGGTFFNSSFLFDVKGNDTYIGGDFSLGSAIFGLGVVVDFNGNDRYTGGLCTQGSAVFGIGLLLDRNGNDVYNSQTQSQGFGFTKGFGTLADYNGNDHYMTSSPFQDFLRYDKHFISFSQGAGLGMRPVASGGIGMLQDYDGNDFYTSDIFAQGTSYWFAIGILNDLGGDDHYQAHQYAQGSGIHLASALLWDDKGNDKYRAHGVSLGCGHDLAFGALIDNSGNDEYTAFGLSIGGGNANALSLFIDIEGDDSYIAKTPRSMHGFSDTRRDYGMFGIFIDGKGKDLYSQREGNNSYGLKSTFGFYGDFQLFVDTTDKKKKKEPALTPEDSLKDPLASTIDSLFIQGSAAPQKYQYNVQPARDSILILGQTPQGLSFLAGKLSTESARERHALRDILEKLYEKDSTAITKLIVDSLNSTNRYALAMAADIAGRKKIKGAIPALQQLLQSERWQSRETAIRNLGKMEDLALIPTMIEALKDSNPQVQIRATYGLGILTTEENVKNLAPLAMESTYTLARNNYILGIMNNKDTLSSSAVLPVYHHLTSEEGRKSFVQIIPYLKEEGYKSIRAYRKLFNTIESPEILKILYLTIKSSPSNFWKSVAKRYISKEKNHNLQKIVQSIEVTHE